jgi:hypothetical protein
MMVLRHSNLLCREHLSSKRMWVRDRRHHPLSLVRQPRYSPAVCRLQHQPSPPRPLLRQPPQYLLLRQCRRMRRPLKAWVAASGQWNHRRLHRPRSSLRRRIEHRLTYRYRRRCHLSLLRQRSPSPPPYQLHTLSLPNPMVHQYHTQGFQHRVSPLVRSVEKTSKTTQRWQATYPSVRHGRRKRPLINTHALWIADSRSPIPRIGSSPTPTMTQCQRGWSLPSRR